MKFVPLSAPDAYLIIIENLCSPCKDKDHVNVSPLYCYTLLKKKKKKEKSLVYCAKFSLYVNFLSREYGFWKMIEILSPYVICVNLVPLKHACW